MTRSDTLFPSGADVCAGWFYEPNAAPDRPGPVIVMAHGLGGVKEMGLDAFAERFTAAGYRCLVFDYRHFGASGGEPRQVLDVARQLEDWRSAVAHARGLAGVDPYRVVVWGTSFGGGHVLHTAARDPRLAAVVAQCPFTDGIASSLAIPLRTTVKVLLRALRDLVAARRGGQPVTIPTYGPPGSTALMTSPDSAAGVEALLPPRVEVRSDVAARFALDIVRYVPGRDTAKIGCPVHFAVCEDDSVAPTGATLRHAARAPRGEIKLQAGGHFDIYVGDDFERNVAQQIAFLTTHVPVDPASAPKEHP